MFYGCEPVLALFPLTLSPHPPSQPRSTAEYGGLAAYNISSKSFTFLCGGYQPAFTATNIIVFKETYALALVALCGNGGGGSWIW